MCEFKHGCFFIGSRSGMYRWQSDALNHVKVKAVNISRTVSESAPVQAVNIFTILLCVQIVQTVSGIPDIGCTECRPHADWWM